MLSHQRCFASTAAGLLVLGCGSADVTSPPPVTIAAGVYRMTSVNGLALPTNIADDKSPVWIKSGSLTIELSGSFTSEVAYTRLVGESWIEATESCSGTYVRNSRGLAFSLPVGCNGPISATVDGGILKALVNPSIRVEYKP